VEGLDGDISVNQCIVASRALVCAIPHKFVSCEASFIFLWEAMEDIRRAKLQGDRGNGNASFVIHVVNISIQVTDQYYRESGVLVVFGLQDIQFHVRCCIGCEV